MLALQRTANERRDDGTTPLELEFDDLHAALAEGYSLVDIREPKEIDEMPLETDALPVPMGELLAGRNLPSEGRYLLICARGSRSLGTARSLRDRGLDNVYSLKGGALGLPERQGRI